MDHLIFTAAAGAAAIGAQQSAISNNLANVSTVAFKADLIRAESRYLSGAGQQDSRAFATAVMQGNNLAAGPLQNTDRDLDVAVNGEGWIGVQAPDGSEALTRRGDLRVNEFGQLLNGVGQPVLGNSGPIAVPPFDAISVGADGTVSIVPLGQDPNAQVALDRIRLVNPAQDTLKKGLDGLFRSAQPVAADASVRLVQGALEGSNVSAVGEMVSMIELSRQFETQVRLMSMAQEMDTSTARLMQLE